MPKLDTPVPALPARSRAPSSAAGTAPVAAAEGPGPAPSRARPAVPTVRTAVLGVGAYLPARVVTNGEVARRIEASSPGRGLGALARAALHGSGMAERRYIAEGDDASDLAVRAAEVALAEAGVGMCDVPLLIFASGSQDLMEPATAHVVSAKLGGASAVFDVKNACNSFLSGMQVADALVRAGAYPRALVCTGEAPSMAARWAVPDRDALRESFVGYTLGDAGAAVVLERRVDGTGIEWVAFRSRSEDWELCTVRAGGTMHWYDHEAHRYFHGFGNGLRATFESWGGDRFHEILAEAGDTVDDFDVVLLHQVTGTYVEAFLAVTGVPASKTVPIVGELGNIASASIPVQLERARRAGRIGTGSRVLAVGLGAGVSLGLAALRT